MTKRSSAAKKPAAAKAKPEAKANETRPAQGDTAKAKLEGAAAPEGGTTAKVSEAQTSADTVDPTGTDSAPAAPSGSSREQAEAPSADRMDEAEEGKEPGATARPPVAGDLDDACFIVTGPKAGFRRAGRTFGSDPVELRPEDFFVDGQPGGFAAAAALFSILEEPRLTCILRVSEGDYPMTPEFITWLRDLVAEAVDAHAIAPARAAFEEAANA